tara:strand:- start:740 stop:1252 length:513 start_codon:yes stop_codon:yes gene_type:complete
MLALLALPPLSAPASAPWPMQWPAFFMPPMMMAPTAPLSAPSGAINLVAGVDGAQQQPQPQQTQHGAATQMPMMPMMMPGMMPGMMPPSYMMMLALRDAVMKHQAWSVWPVGKEWVRSDGAKYASAPPMTNSKTTIALGRTSQAKPGLAPAVAAPLAAAPAAKKGAILME